MTSTGARAAPSIATRNIDSPPAHARERRAPALGARLRDIALLVARQGIAVSAAGVLVGLAVSLALDRLIGQLLYCVRPHDVTSLLAAPALLLLAVVCVTPALRAARVDPCSCCLGSSSSVTWGPWPTPPARRDHSVPRLDRAWQPLRKATRARPPGCGLTREPPSYYLRSRAMECSEGKELEIETALREALANAIRHGCAHDATKSVKVDEVSFENGGTEIRMRKR